MSNDPYPKIHKSTDGKRELKYHETQFDPSKYQGKWDSYLPIRFDCHGKPVLPFKPDVRSSPNPDYVTPPEGTITGGGFEGDREFVFIMRDGQPVRYFRENENGPAPCETDPNPQG